VSFCSFQFETDIWFPKSVTIDISFTTNDENQQTLPTFRKITMQVQRAVFNIPIAEKDMRFRD